MTTVLKGETWNHRTRHLFPQTVSAKDERDSRGCMSKSFRRFLGEWVRTSGVVDRVLLPKDKKNYIFRLSTSTWTSRELFLDVLSEIVEVEQTGKTPSHFGAAHASVSVGLPCLKERDLRHRGPVLFW